MPRCLSRGLERTNMDFRQLLFKYRSYTPIPFILWMLVVAQPAGLSILVGFCLLSIGELIRLWGVSLAGSETRTTGPVGGSTLVTSGPFAYVRNPLYVGNMMIYFGVGIMANTPILAIVALIYFFFQYTMIVSLEEEALVRLFGQEYITYVGMVPRFVPTFKKFQGQSPNQPQVDWKKGLRSEQRTLQAAALVTAVILVLWIIRGF
jgi:protein-S-isoprenylcysteine O-methyltransferase Ste14